MSATAECQHRKRNFAGMKFSRRKKAAACFVFLQLLEEVTENESNESAGGGKQLTEELSSTIMKNLNTLKVNDS